MKISKDWLSDFVDWIETDPAVIADQLTRRTGEVDDVEQKGAMMENVVVGKIVTLGKHPNADKLSVCTVETDRGIKKIVCGGTNLKEGMLVALAHVGATVKAGGKEIVTLTKAKIRGEESEGMICASEELEIEALFPVTPDQGVRPVADLTSKGFVSGTPLKQALGLTDVVFHIDNHAITNRPDLFSHVGVARELVAMGLAKWKSEPKIASIQFPSAAPAFAVKNDVPDLVAYYEAALLRVDGSGPSPEWMQRRLAATGWRTINLMVDVTNYVLMEIGMPLHAFDADDFQGDITIRKAKKGEKITTLDKAVRELPEGALVISDNDGIFDLFGVMGGLRSSNKPTTRNVFLQAGIIDPVSVRRTVIAMDHRTDAATVYEKGVLPITASTGLRRAIELLNEHANGGCKTASKVVTWGKSDAPKAVEADLGKIQRYIGAPIDEKQMRKILTDLGCEIQGKGTTLAVAPPAWRRDLTHLQDIAEEVARIYGYANIPSVMPDACITPPARERTVHMLRDTLKEEGAVELIHLAFVSPELITKAGGNPADAVSIENPIGEEISLMRMQLLPAILQTAGKQLANTERDALMVYEHGHVFTKTSEQAELVIAVVARSQTSIKNDPLLMVKASLIRALASAGYAVTVTKTTTVPSIAHSGRAAEITCGDVLIGSIFEIHPSVRAAFDLPARAAAAVIDLDALLRIEPTVQIAKPIPVFPAVTLDETTPIGTSVSQAVLLQKIRLLSPLIETVTPVDYYAQGATRNMTLRFVYRANDRTLTQQEVDAVHKGVLAELAKAGR